MLHRMEWAGGGVPGAGQGRMGSRGSPGSAVELCAPRGSEQPGPGLAAAAPASCHPHQLPSPQAFLPPETSSLRPALHPCTSRPNYQHPAGARVPVRRTAWQRLPLLCWGRRGGGGGGGIVYEDGAVAAAVVSCCSHQYQAVLTSPHDRQAYFPNMSRFCNQQGWTPEVPCQVLLWQEQVRKRGMTEKQLNVSVPAAHCYYLITNRVWSAEAPCSQCQGSSGTLVLQLLETLSFSR